MKVQAASRGKLARTGLAAQQAARVEAAEQAAAAAQIQARQRGRDARRRLAEEEVAQQHFEDRLDKGFDNRAQTAP